MIKYALLSLLMMLCVLPAYAQERTQVPAATDDLLQDPMPGTDVRWFIWGVPPEDVVTYEKVVLFEKVDNTLFFIDDINGFKTLISYEFYKNRLWRVTYDIQKDNYPNPQGVIDDFVSMEIMMNKRFGEPAARETLWRNEYYKNKHNRWGLAVYNGHLELRMRWENPRTEAVMNVKAQDYDYQFRIVHTARAIAAEIERDQNREELAPPPTIAAPPALRDTP